MLFPVVVLGQNTQGQSVVTAGAGWSLLGAIFSVADGVSDTQTKVTPVIHGSFDYAITDNMSFGAAIGYQKATISYDDYEYFNADNVLVSEDFDWTISRLNIGARALFHYGKKENFDMYSGLRFGYQNFSSKYDTNDPSFKADFKGGAMGMQLILFGARGYFNDHIGFNAELAVGSPYFVMGGLNYRFGG